ncbi:MAG: 6-phosphofructokinase [Bacteroidales bacterium]|nr:6-phosphofructokinase [Bacteroidales bacterium]MDD6003924.1 6-phosphofructokinase [Bacteroidales bacterium]
MKVFKNHGTIGILTGGGDVPGLNPAIRRIVGSAIAQNYKVLGIKRGWAGLVEMVRSRNVDNRDCFEEFSQSVLNATSMHVETFLHSSRTKPSELKADDVPEHLKDLYNEPTNDLTPEVIKNIEYLGIDCLVVIGGDDTLKYALRLHNEGVKIVGIPKTMDGDVPGTDYCLGFSTCITRTIDLINTLSVSAGSHERFLVIEVFGRYAGFTAMLPAVVGVANRCVIPEYKFSVNQLAELLVEDRAKSSDHFSTVVVSEGAKFNGFEPQPDATGHLTHGCGEELAYRLRKASAKYNGGKRIDTIFQNLGYLVRTGCPDFSDSIVPIGFANVAMESILNKNFGVMTALRSGKYTTSPLEVVASETKVVDVEKFYDTELLCPKKAEFSGRQMMWMTSL